MLNNIKTEYNFLSSYIKLDDIIEYAVEQNLSYLGICDINTTYANYKFYQMCIKNNIKPVIGLELNYKNQQYLIYAKNCNGIRRINELNTNFNKTATVKFNISEPDIKLVLGKGIIADSIIKNTTSCEMYQKLDHIFNGAIYLGILSNMNDGNNFLKYEKIKEANIKAIYIDEIKFIKESDVEYYMTLLAIKEGKLFKNYNKNNYLHHALEYKHNIDSEIQNQTAEFLSDINITFPEIKLRPPVYNFNEEGQSSFEHLKKLCIEGLNNRLDNKVTTEYKERLIHELRIINEMQFNDYFLIMWDVVKYAKNNEILVGPGRGSAAGSLVSYCLNITDVDPVVNGLVFERFLNPRRISMPDIDVDFQDVNRNEIVEYIIERFGSENVCKIGTITHMQAKMAIRDVGKAFGVKPQVIEILVAEITGYNKSFERNLAENIQIKKLALQNDSISRIIDIILHLEGIPRQSSIHAAGVLMVDTKLIDYCSVNNENVSMCEAKELEGMGLLKMDILSLSNLTFISRIIKQINIGGTPFTIDDIKLGDTKVYNMLATGKTFGIFQLESEGMRQTIIQIKPTSVGEIADTISLYRPGPKEFIPQYIASKDYKAKEEMDKVFSATRGILIYQEQILLFAQQIAGYDLGEAEILRRAISKKDYKVIKDLESDFIKRGAQITNQKDATRAFEIIMKFANYGFNKAHAYSYAKIIYQMSYLKVNFPQIFYSELFYYNFNSPKRDLFISEVKASGINFLVPHILYSGEKVSIEQNNLRLGFGIIEGIGDEIIKQIISNRQFIKNPNDIVDVVTTLFAKSNVTKAQIASLIDAGCFDSFGYNRHTLHNNLHGLTNVQIVNMLAIGSTIDINIEEEYSVIKLAEMEKDAIKFNVIYNLFEDMAIAASRKYNIKVTTIDQIYRSINPGMYVILVKLKSLKVIKTKKGDQMCFLTVNSEGENDITMFPREYNANLDIVNKRGKMLLMKVNVDKEHIVFKALLGGK